MEARCPSNRHFFLESPAHGVVGAFHGCPSVFAFEFHGPVFRVVGDFPDARGCFYQRLVAVRVVLGCKGFPSISDDARIPVEFIGFIVRGAAEFESFLPVADVVVLMVIRSSTTPGVNFYLYILIDFRFLSEKSFSSPGTALTKFPYDKFFILYSLHITWTKIGIPSPVCHNIVRRIQFPHFFN